MRGRPGDPDSCYRVRVYKSNGYVYAGTQPFTENEETGERKRRSMLWERLIDGKFIPNQRYQLLSPEERARLIFPEDGI